MSLSPDEFISPDFPYSLRFVNVQNTKLAYVDTNPQRMGNTFIFLHGNPTSSYLWRNIIPHVEEHARCIAPDLVAMGKSEKPANFDGRFDSHAVYLEAFLEKMTGGKDMVYLVLHDWGSALGLDWARKHEHQVAGIVLMEFLRPWPTWEDFAESSSARHLFQRFRDPAEGRKLLIDENAFIEQVLPNSVCRSLTEVEMAHYRAPFEKIEDREPVYRFPNELPIANSPPDVYSVAEAYHNWLLVSNVEKLFFWASPGGVVSEKAAKFYAENLLNCRSIYVGAGMHYLQEDHPHLIGIEITKWLSSRTTGLAK